MRKLYKYVNESKIKGVNSCYICGNILYINALEVADKYGIPLVINGYSKGQVVQVNDKNKGTELLDLIIQIIKESGDEEFINQFTEKYNILQKRTTFIDKNDLLNFIPDNKKILFIPFYIFKFNKIDKEKLKEQVRKVFDWKTLKTSYPGRTTNCDMIWLNTYVDIQKNGYSNYTVEYAELIRKKEITREQALKDLSFNPLPGELETLARSIGLELALIDNKNEYAPPKTDVKELDIDFEF